MKMRCILYIIAMDFLLCLSLIACGSNSSSGGTSTNTPTPTIDQAMGITATPTANQATPTQTPTIDQGQPTQPPTPTITPTQLRPDTCTLTGTGWDCSVILSGQNTSLDWSVTSPDLPAADITFNPSSGTLSANNQYQQKVTISIVSADCQSGTGGTFVFSFSGGAREARVSWSCS